jgi:small subunit ribosomal protein S2
MAETKNTITSLEELFDLGAHIGHSKSRRHPKMKKFIFGTRNNIELFDLEKTAAALATAEDFVTLLGRTGKTILWVGSKPSARKAIGEAGEALGMPYVTERWLGGMMTNFKVIEERLNYWKRLEQEVASGGLEKYVKRERLLKINELRKMTRMFAGLRSLKNIPDAMVIVDPGYEDTAVSEARNKKLAIVALLSNDCDPSGIKYPIPVNDDSLNVIGLIIKRLVSAYEAGKREFISAQSLEKKS